MRFFSAQVAAGGGAKPNPEAVDKAGGRRVVQLRLPAEKAASGDRRVDDVLVEQRMRG
jgi:hypothetical protein